MEYFVSLLCLIIIAMLSAYFIRENALRKEQLQINRDQLNINQALTDAISELGKSIILLKNK